MALILIYTCVLVIKTCDASPLVCSTYGLGDTAQGVVCALGKRVVTPVAFSHIATYGATFAFACVCMSVGFAR